MGEYISMGDGLIVTLFSIAMVFIVLIIISIFISMLKNFDRKKEEPIVVKGNKDIKTDIIKSEEEMDKKPDDEELIAVLSAAVAASLGVSLPQINIKSIKRVSNTSPVWGVAGIQEQIYNKL